MNTARDTYAMIGISVQDRHLLRSATRRAWLSLRRLWCVQPERTARRREWLAALRLCLCLCVAAGSVQSQAQAPQAAGPVSEQKLDFRQHVLPILQAQCLACHSASRREAGLVLETPQAIRAGGSRGPAVIPGKPQESLLLAVAGGTAEPVMPPAGNDVGARPLDAAELDLLRRWIEQGAEDGAATRPEGPRWRRPPSGWHPGWAVRFSSDDVLIAFSRGTQLFVHDAQGGGLVTQLADPALGEGQADRDSVRAIAFHPGGELLAAAGYKAVRLWRRPRNVQRWQWEVPVGVEAQGANPSTGQGGRGVLAASPDGRWLAVSQGDGVIRTFAAADGQPGALLVGHTDAAVALRYSADGRTLYSASLDGTVRLWDAVDARPLRRLGLPGPARHLAVLDESGKIATSEAGGFVQFWRLGPPASQRIARLAAPATALAVLPSDRTALVGGEDGRLRRLMLDVPHIVTLARRTPHTLRCLALWPDGSRVALPAAEGAVEIVPLGSQETFPSLFLDQVEVTDLAIHPQGHLVAVATQDGLLRLWRPEAKATPLAMTDAPPTAAAASSDGRWLATAEEYDGRPAAVVRNLERGEVTHLLLGHTHAIRALAFSPNALRLATASEDGTVRLWNLGDPRMPELGVLPAHDGPATAVCFADGQTLLTAGADGQVCTYNIDRPSEPLRALAHKGGVTGMAVHRSTAITVGADGMLRMASLDGTAAREVELAGPALALSVATAAPRAAVAVELSSRGAAEADEAGGDAIAGIQIIDLESAGVIQTLGRHEVPPHALALNPEGTRLTSAGAKGVFAWDVQQGLLLSALPVPPCTSLLWQTGGEVTCITAEGAVVRASTPVEKVVAAHQGRASIAWSVDGNRLFSAGSDGTIRGWDSDLRTAFDAALGTAVFDIAVSPAGNAFAVACGDGRLVLFDLGGNPSHELAGFAGDVRCAAFSPDGRYAAGGDAQGQVRLYNVQERRCVQVYPVHKAAVTGVGLYFVPAEDSGKQVCIVSASSDGTVRRNRLLATRRIQAHDSPLTAMVGLGDGRLLTGGGSLVREWNADGQLLRQFELGAGVVALAVRPDGARMAAAGENGVTRLWNLQDGQQLAELRGDFRLAAEAERLARRAEILQSRLAANEELLAQAQNDTPPRAAEAESRQSALAAAERNHAERMAALQSATAALQEAQAAAFVATRQASEAQQAAGNAARKVERLEKVATRAGQRAERARRAAAANPDNEMLAHAAETAEHESQQAAEDLKQARDLLTAAEQQLATLAPTATEAQARVAALAAQADQARQAAEEAMAAVLEARRAAEAAAAAYREAQALFQSSQALKTSLQEALERLRERQQALESDFQASLRPATTVAFSQQGVFAIGSDNGTVYLWNDATGRPADVLETHSGPMQDLAFVPGGLAAAASGRAAVWELAPQWTLARVLGGDEADLPVDRVLALDFSPDGTLLATAGGEPSRSGELVLWDAASGRLLAHAPQAHTDTIFAAAFSPDGRYLATGAADRLLKVFSIPDLREVYRFEGHAHNVLAVAWRSDGERLASAGAEGVVRIWNPHAGEPLLTIEGFAKPVTSLRFLPGTSSVVSGSGDKLLRQHEIDGGNLLRTWEGTDYINAIDLTENGQQLAAIDHSGVVRIWHIESGQLVHALQPGAQPASEGQVPAAETP